MVYYRKIEHKFAMSFEIPQPQKPGTKMDISPIVSIVLGTFLVLSVALLVWHCFCGPQHQRPSAAIASSPTHGVSVEQSARPEELIITIPLRSPAAAGRHQHVINVAADDLPPSYAEATKCAPEHRI